MSQSDAWLGAYFKHASSVSNGRFYFGPGIKIVWQPDPPIDLPPNTELLCGEVKCHFHKNQVRCVYLLLSPAGLQRAVCGELRDDGSIKKGCARGCAAWKGVAANPHLRSGSGRCGHIAALALHLMMEVNPQMKIKYYSKNQDAIQRPTTAWLAEGIANYADEVFLSARGKKRAAKYEDRKRKLAARALASQ
jgi:hypothetical protein